MCPAQLKIYDLVGGNTTKLDALLAVYEEMFPQYLHYRPLMQARASRSATVDPRFVEHQWLAELDGQPAAIVVFKYVPARNVGLLMDLAVRPCFRAAQVGTHTGLAQHLIRAGQQQLAADAVICQRPVPCGLVAEVESGRLVKQFQNYGLIELPIDYFEPSTTPALAQLQDPRLLANLTFRRMHLGVFPTAQASQQDFSFDLMCEIVLALLCDHYGLPVDHWAAQRALRSISTMITAGVNAE